MKRGIAVVIGVLLLLYGIYNGINFGDNIAKSLNNTNSEENSGQNAIQAINNATSNYKLEEIQKPYMVKTEYNSKTINGQLKNVSGKTISYVQIMFALYDKDGAQVGTAVANINNLTENAVWKYSAIPLTSESWISFKQTEIDSW